ncbi:hypothetical protein Ciccas_011885 [Cichlidogyrus casuarinus]|uniref:Uncharacterized protein n=1 Tax=Cichlidogyrus casuarinus TaxID=1844966 RepID=A0ABD2PR83_9PLAT
METESEMAGSQCSPPISTSIYLQNSSSPDSMEQDRTIQIQQLGTAALQDLIHCSSYNRYSKHPSHYAADQALPANFINLGTIPTSVSISGDGEGTNYPIVYSLTTTNTEMGDVVLAAPGQAYQIISPAESHAFNVISPEHLPLSFKILDPQGGGVT